MRTNLAPLPFAASRDPFTAPASPAYLTHRDLLAIAEANRLYDAIERVNDRLERELRRGVPTAVRIDRISLELA